MVIAVLIGVSLAFTLAVVGERMRGGLLRAQSTSVFFLLLVVLPLAQLLPLPSFLRGKIDPAGVALLANAPDGTPRVWPFSLDPYSTETEIGVAAGALVVFVLAAHDATRRRHRKPLLDAIALGGVLAVASGLVHRIFGVERLYGIFDVYGAVFPGPFINPNHSAEFYELAAFSALALALGGSTESRIAWFAAAGVNAAAALSTLSRGAFLALLVGGAAFVALRWRADRTDEAGAEKPRLGRLGRTIAWSLFAAVCLACAAFALGASPVLDEVANTNLAGRGEKIVVWKDSWSIVLRHPLGIGRHAFDRVYPIYKTLTMNSRFVFVENGPLQLLIDVGWPGLALLGGAVAWLAWKVRQGWKGDYMDAALLAGLVAVGAHNLVDFGIETMGIRLPFAALAGILVGRCAFARSEPAQGGKGTMPFTAIAVGATVAVGIAVGLHAALGVSAEDIEERWRRNTPGRERREIALSGARRFPTDSYFALLQSYDEPLRPLWRRGPSPRLMALNRALRLCPSCSFVHQQVARALLALGLRSQALSSFRDAVRLNPSATAATLAELDAEHFTPAEWATLAVGDASQTLEVARYLVSKGAASDAASLVDDAAQKGAPVAEAMLAKAELALAMGRSADAKATLEEGRRLGSQDGRFDEALSVVAEHEGQMEQALTEARIATTLSPFSVPFARRRLDLVQRLKKWDDLEDALSLLKVALRQNGQDVAEVHKAFGDILVSRGNLGRALSEYKTAATLAPTDPTIWAAVGHTCEARGDLNGASAAYHRQAALQPGDTDVQQAIARVEKARTTERINQMLSPL